MPIILDPNEYDHWMSCKVEEARAYFRIWQGEFVGKPEPRQARPQAEESKEPKEPKPPKPTKPPKPAPTPKPPPPQGSLF